MALNLFDQIRRKQNLKLLGVYLFIFICVVIVGISLSSRDPKPEVNDKDKPEPEISLDTNTYCTEIDGLTSTEFDIETQITQECDIKVIRNPVDARDMELIWSKTYVFVTATETDLTNMDLNNEQLTETIQVQRYLTHDLIWDRDTHEFLRSRFNNGIGQKYSSSAEIIKELNERAGSVGIIPFEDIDRSVKIITIRDQSPLSAQFAVDLYPLSDRIWVTKGGSDDRNDEVKTRLEALLGEEGFQTDKVISLILTGRSALGSRVQSVEIANGKSPTYMVQNIKSLLSSADITHLSQHSSFTKDCTQSAISASLCGNIESRGGLKAMGIDVVGLNGTHTLDAGRTPFLEDIAYYKENKITHYGGGVDFQDAHRGKIVQAKSAKVQFYGYNTVIPGAYLPGVDRAGISWPDATFRDGSQMRKDLSQRDKDSTVIVEFDWGVSNSTNYTALQQIYARVAIDNGADIVFGTGGGRVQGVEEYNDGLIFYNLGNFLYNMSGGERFRESYVVKLLIYDNEVITYELIPTFMQSDSTVGVAVGSEKDRIESVILNQ